VLGAVPYLAANTPSNHAKRTWLQRVLGALPSLAANIPSNHAKQTWWQSVLGDSFGTEISIRAIQTCDIIVVAEFMVDVAGIEARAYA
jgi:hypothetical protein